jgi:hypothetical protein
LERTVLGKSAAPTADASGAAGSETAAGGASTEVPVGARVITLPDGTQVLELADGSIVNIPGGSSAAAASSEIDIIDLFGEADLRYLQEAVMKLRELLADESKKNALEQTPVLVVDSSTSKSPLDILIKGYTDSESAATIRSLNEFGDYLDDAIASLDDASAQIAITDTSSDARNRLIRGRKDTLDGTIIEVVEEYKITINFIFALSRSLMKQHGTSLYPVASRYPQILEQVEIEGSDETSGLFARFIPGGQGFELDLNLTSPQKLIDSVKFFKEALEKLLEPSA